MMKKGMIRFLATGMTALTLMGTAAAFAPAAQVFAAEAEAMDETSDTTHELKRMSMLEAKNYVKELTENKAPYQEYENIKMYRVGDKVYSISMFDERVEDVKETFPSHKLAKAFYEECLERGMFDGICEKVYFTPPSGVSHYDYSLVKGKILGVTLSVTTYTVKPVETVTITANKTMIHPGECAILQFQVNEGADVNAVTWRAVGAEGIADFCADGNQAFVTGFETGTVMVVAETEDGVRDYIHINICE